jgi:hypothetical protein
LVASEKQSISTTYFVLNRILFADSRSVIASTEDKMQRAEYARNYADLKYNLKIIVNEKMAMAMKGKMNARTKIITRNHVFENPIVLIT